MAEVHGRQELQLAELLRNLSCEGKARGENVNTMCVDNMPGTTPNFESAAPDEMLHTANSTKLNNITSRHLHPIEGTIDSSAHRTHDGRAAGFGPQREALDSRYTGR